MVKTSYFQAPFLPFGQGTKIFRNLEKKIYDSLLLPLLLRILSGGPIIEPIIEPIITLSGLVKCKIMEFSVDKVLT